MADTLLIRVIIGSAEKAFGMIILVNDITVIDFGYENALIIGYELIFAETFRAAARRRLRFSAIRRKRDA